MAAPTTKEEWLGCLLLPEYVEAIPLGQIRPIVGSIRWVDGGGSWLTQKEYIAKWGIDPEPAWAAVKEYHKQHRGGVRVLD